MADTFQLEIVTPEKKVVDTKAEEVQIPGKNGYLADFPDTLLSSPSWPSAKSRSARAMANRSSPLPGDSLKFSPIR